LSNTEREEYIENDLENDIQQRWWMSLGVTQLKHYVLALCFIREIATKFMMKSTCTLIPFLTWRCKEKTWHISSAYAYKKVEIWLFLIQASSLWSLLLQSNKHWGVFRMESPHNGWVRLRFKSCLHLVTKACQIQMKDLMNQSI
jgi:hypothetical protein